MKFIVVLSKEITFKVTINVKIQSVYEKIISKIWIKYLNMFTTCYYYNDFAWTLSQIAQQLVLNIHYFVLFPRLWRKKMSTTHQNKSPIVNSKTGTSSNKRTTWSHKSDILQVFTTQIGKSFRATTFRKSPDAFHVLNYSHTLPNNHILVFLQNAAERVNVLRIERSVVFFERQGIFFHRDSFQRMFFADQTSSALEKKYDENLPSGNTSLGVEYNSDFVGKTCR